MRTDEFIRALAADHATAARPRLLPSRFTLLALLALVAATCLLWIVLGPRPDLGEAALAPRVAFKFVVALALALVAGLLAVRTARPEDDARPWPFVLPVLALLVVGVGAELAVSPAAAWPALLIGRNPLACLLLIPLFSLLPLLAAFAALRQGAPGSPTRAGLLAGLFAGGLGAAVWAMHCTDDSPLFVAAWYVPAIAAVAAAGAALGGKLLRW